jgi:LPS export ABC transporter protein LptC
VRPAARALLLPAAIALLTARCKGVEPEPAPCVALPAATATRSFDIPAAAREGQAHGEASWPAWVLSADSGSALLGEETIRLCGPQLVGRDSVDRVVASISAMEGELDRRNGFIVARGGVVIDLPLQGRRIEAEELHWAPEEDRVWSPGPTTFREGGVVVSGESFEADSRFETIHVRRARARGAPP